MTTYLITFTETVEIEAETPALAIHDARVSYTGGTWDAAVVKVVQEHRVHLVEELIPQPSLTMSIPITEWGEPRNWSEKA